MLLLSTILFVLLVVVGSVLLWQYLPEESRGAVASNFINTQVPDYVFAQCTMNDDNCCNGLNNTCDLRADEIMYAGLHNAMSAIENGFLVGANHDLSMEKALEAGFRAVNVDFGKCNGKSLFYHGKCEIGSRDPILLLSNIVKFLDENPTEIIVITVQFTNDAKETNPANIATLDDLVAVVNSVEGFVEKSYAHPGLSEPWPTLRELRDTGKQIIFFHYNIGICFQDGCPFGFHDYFVYAEETDFELASFEDIEDKSQSCNVTRGSNRATFFGINLFLTIPSRSTADQVNSLSFLQQHVNDCEEINGGNLANIVWVDFWAQGELPLFVQQSNQQRGSNSQI